MATILVVDDQDDNRNLLRTFLEKGGFEVVEARNGSQALMQLSTDLPDLMLLDIVMPELDGYEVCRRLKSDKNISALPVIFLSAKDEVADKVKGFELGASDYITKPFQKAEVLARVRTHVTINSLTKDLKTQNRRLMSKQAKIEEDLKAAAEIQRSLLPTQLPHFGNCSLASRFMPSDLSSGDIFNVHQLDADTIGMYIVDVSGHGVPAAMVTVSIAQSMQPLGQSLLKQQQSHAPYYRLASPLEVISALDKMYPLSRFDKFFTMVYLVFNIRTGEMRYCNAGHPYPARTDTSGRNTWLKVGGPMIGLGDMVPFEEERTFLKAGDRIYLYTDGIIEFMNQENSQFGMQRLEETLSLGAGRSLEETCDLVLDTLKEFGEGGRLDDDITLLALEFLGPTCENQD